MKFMAVSTFNRAGLELYGLRMMESFHNNWPSDIDLRVYTEGWNRATEGCNGEDKHSRIYFPDLLCSVPWLSEFKGRHARDPKPRDFKFDAIRFAHKVAAVCHAARAEGIDVLIWLDGDIFTHSSISIRNLEELAPKGDQWIAWLDRRRLYPECGFYMLNCRHHSHLRMVNEFEDMYTEDLLFGLKEWHDSYVLQHVVDLASRHIKGFSAKSLSGQHGFRTSHPMINGQLGTWFDHLKGPRKQEGKSRTRDLKVRRKEEYWA